MSFKSPERRPDVTARDRVFGWYVEAAAILASARSGLGRVNDTSTMDFEALNQVSDILWDARGQLELMGGSLLVGEDIAKVKGFDDCYQEVIEKPGHVDREPDMENLKSDRKYLYVANRTEMEDRFEALMLMLNDMKSYLVSKGLFGFTEDSKA